MKTSVDVLEKVSPVEWSYLDTGPGDKIFTNSPVCSREQNVGDLV